MNAFTYIEERLFTGTVLTVEKKKSTSEKYVKEDIFTYRCYVVDIDSEFCTYLVSFFAT